MVDISHMSSDEHDHSCHSGSLYIQLRYNGSLFVGIAESKSL